MFAVMIPLLTLLFLLATSFYFSPLFVRTLGRWLGWHLQSRSRGRRAILAARVCAEEKQWLEKHQGGNPSEDEEWETIDSYAAGLARKGEKAEREWEGVVGFFHPFW